MTSLKLPFRKSALALASALVLIGSAQAAHAVGVDKVRTYRDGDVFVTELVTIGAWDESEANATFNGGVVQVEIPQGTLTKGKHLVRPEDKLVKSVALSTTDTGSLKAKLTLKDGFLAKSLDGRVRIHRRADNTVTIEVEGDAEKGPAGRGEAEIARLLPIINGEGEDAAVSSRLVAGSPESAAATAATEASGENKAIGDVNQAAEKKIDTSKLSESEIPVLTAPQQEKKANGFDLQRVVITLAVIATVLGGAILGLKRWAAKSAGKAASNTKIKVLTQHHLGPKKSLVIIQVAGESLLVGVTDHNISMLKTLSLLDEEVPETEEVPRNFGNALAGFEEDEDEAEPAPRSRGRRQARESEPIEDFAMRGLSEIRDVVSTRLKGFKNF